MLSRSGVHPTRPQPHDSYHKLTLTSAVPPPAVNSDDSEMERLQALQLQALQLETARHSIGATAVEMDPATAALAGADDRGAPATGDFALAIGGVDAGCEPLLRRLPMFVSCPALALLLSLCSCLRPSGHWLCM